MLFLEEEITLCQTSKNDKESQTSTSQYRKYLNTRLETYSPTNIIHNSSYKHL